MSAGDFTEMRTLRFAAVIGLVSTAVLAGAQDSQRPPTFRSRVTVVPLDVRVLGANGKPIQDLTASDFTVLEDGVPQRVVHFSFQNLEPIPVPAEDAPLELRRPFGETLTSQDKRIFLIVLGRGRQVGPVKGVEASMRFVRERLLPQDQVAVFAFNRATDFTNDHRKVLDTIEHYWKKHEWIESRLRHHFSGLAAVYGSPEIPQHIQTEIDGIFRAPGALAGRRIEGTEITDGKQLAADERRARDLILRTDLAAERLAVGVGTPFDDAMASPSAVLSRGFDEYVEKAFDTKSDLGNLYAGIRYMRTLDGEKHLVFITPNGLNLPRAENARTLAVLANDARVTIDVIHTYGMAPAQVMGRGGVVRRAPAFGQVFERADSREIARLTGGQMMSGRSGEAFFKRLDESTRAQYLIGYSPSNPSWDGRYRRIEVKVKRERAQVSYRHGYTGPRDTAAPPAR